MATLEAYAKFDGVFHDDGEFEGDYIEEEGLDEELEHIEIGMSFSQSADDV
jgi:hypothetical protein